ncbi:hypothetical protein BMS3Abin08_00116 [bacterium BMS3Abin08]|nr:hypothetical protein BMS3Abin08_00116 [bacterium BMS3Abin08]
MIVVPHDAVCIDFDTILLHCPLEYLYKILFVTTIIREDLFALIPSRQDMIYCPFVLYSQRSHHAAILSYDACFVTVQGLTLVFLFLSDLSYQMLRIVIYCIFILYLIEFL